jgi:hypothetical protein
MGGALLVLSAESQDHRRRLGALAWAAFEDMATRARSDDEGWYSRGGVRDIGASMGVTKDTAARAVAALVAAGLVRRDRLAMPDGTRRAAYRLFLPPGVRLCPVNQDGDARPDLSDASKPESSDSTDCHRWRDIGEPDFEDARGCHDSSDRQEGRSRRRDPSSCPGSSDGHPLPTRNNNRAAVEPTRRSDGTSATGDCKPEVDAGPGDAQEPRDTLGPPQRLSCAPDSAPSSTGHRSTRRDRPDAQNAAQGQLFDANGAVTAASQDGAR